MYTHWLDRDKTFWILMHMTQNIIGAAKKVYSLKL